MPRARAITASSSSSAMKLKRSWAVVIDDGHVSVLENAQGSGAYSFPPFHTHTRHCMNALDANEYLEEALAEGKFGALMLVGEAWDVQRFRNALKEPLRRRVLAEIIRPNRDSEFLDERIEEMCA